MGSKDFSLVSDLHSGLLSQQLVLIMLWKSEQLADLINSVKTLFVWEIGFEITDELNRFWRVKRFVFTSLCSKEYKHLELKIWFACKPGQNQ